MAAANLGCPTWARRLGWTPGGWSRLTPAQRFLVTRDAGDRGLIPPVYAQGIGRSLGAPATEDQLAHLPRGADLIGKDLPISDMTASAASSAWWVSAPAIGSPPWDVKLVSASGTGVLKTMQTMLLAGIAPLWTPRYTKALRTTRPPVSLRFDEVTASALYAYAEQVLPKMFPKEPESNAEILKGMDSLLRGHEITAQLTALCIGLTYYQPRRVVSDDGSVTFAKSILGNIGLDDAVPITAQTNALIDSVQLPSGARMWKWGTAYTDPGTVAVPAVRSSGWVYTAQGVLMKGSTSGASSGSGLLLPLAAVAAAALLLGGD